MTCHRTSRQQAITQINDYFTDAYMSPALKNQLIVA